MVAENKDRILGLRAYKYDKDSRLYCQLVDKMILRLLPKELRNKKAIGIYNVYPELSQTNLNRLMRMFKIF